MLTLHHVKNLNKVVCDGGACMSQKECNIGFNQRRMHRMHPLLMETLKFVSEQLNYANVLRKVNYEKQHKWWLSYKFEIKLPFFLQEKLPWE